MARILCPQYFNLPILAQLPGVSLFARWLLIPLLCIFAGTGSTNGQSCTGSLGDPVFKETFGEAPTTSKPTLGGALPAGLTTYTYYSPGVGGRPTGPYPGQYTISNTTRGYNNIYFVDRPDHTTGTFKGYCMVVDAQAAPGKFYERTITGLCAGTTFEFSAWMMNINPQNGVSRPSLRFDLMDANNPNGAPITSVSTGEVAYTAPGTWVRLAGLFQMPSTTSSVILRIFSNTPNSNGNDLALDDIAFAACGPPITFTQAAGIVCAGSGTGLDVSLPAGSYSSYFFQLQRRPLGTTDWDNITGVVSNGVSNQYTFPITNARAGFEYRVLAAGGEAEMSNANCRVVSAPIELKVVDYSVSITGNSPVCYNTAGTLTANIIPRPGTGTPATGYIYTWETSTTGTGGWTTVAGQTGATLNTGALTATQYYRVTATLGACQGDGVSSVFQLSVEPELTASLEPLEAICQGTTAARLFFGISSGKIDRYSITSTDMPGFVPVSLAAFSSGIIPVTIPANVPAGTYNFAITFNASGVNCNTPAYPFTLTVDATPSPAIAGPDQALCAVTSTTLAATAPVAGTGTWSQVSGPSTAAFSDVNSPSATVSGLVAGTYTLRWTVSNGRCASVSDDVEITINNAPSVANAGPDYIQYNSGNFLFIGNIPAVGTGEWSVASGPAVISNPNNPLTSASIPPNTSATLVWTITNANCPPSRDTMVIQYISQADIQIEKTVEESGPYIAGQDFTYRIVVRNAGPSDNPAVLIRDNLPAAFVPSSIQATATGGAVILNNQSAGRQISVNASIPEGSSMVVILAVGKIDPSFEGDLTNTATATSQDIPDPDGAASTITVPVARRPFFVSSKRAPSTVVAGAELTFVIRNGNTGLGNAVNAVFTDNISAKMSNVRWEAFATGGVNIVSGATGTGNAISITANYPAGDTGHLFVTVTGTVVSGATGTIENTATVTPAETTVPPSASNNTSTLIISTPGVLIDKAGPPNHEATAGGPITYTITVLNNGPSDAVNTVITDNIPVSISQVQWSAIALGTATITTGATGTGNSIRLTGNFPAGSSNRVVISVSGMVSPDFAGTIVNTAVAAPSEPGVPPVTDSESVVVTKNVDLSIVKAGPATATAGEQISYTITVSNNGISNSVNSLIRDVISASLTNASWTATVDQGTAVITDGASGTGSLVQVTANMNAGSTIRVVVNATILSGVTGSIFNTSTVTPSEPGTSPVTSDQVETVVASSAALTIGKTGPDAAQAGSNITYVITVGNNGPSNARNLTITDLVPASIQETSWLAIAFGNATINGNASGTDNNILLNGSIAAGKDNLIRIAVSGRIDPGYSGTLSNTAIVTPSEAGSTGDTAVKNTIVTRTPALAITKSAVDSVLAGDSIAYSITVTNISTANAANIQITDIVPPEITGVRWNAAPVGLATISSGATGTGNNVAITANIPAGNVHRIVIRITGKTNPAVNGQIVNTATATPSEPGTTAVSDTETVVIRKIPALGIHKNGPAKLSAGEQIVYTIIVNNTSSSNADNVAIADLIPVPVTNVSWTTATQGSASVVGGAAGTGNSLAVTANIPGGGASNAVIITVKGTIDPLYTGTFTNSATATPTEPEAAAVTSEVVTTTVTRVASVRIRKSGPSVAAAGEGVNYTLIITNSGPSTAEDVLITDAVPVVLTNVTWSSAASGGAVISAGATGTGNNLTVKATIPASTGSVTININGLIRPDAVVDTIRNFATTVSDEAPGQPVRSDTVVTLLQKVPGVLISKTAPSEGFAGETIVYRVRIANTGPSNGRGIVISDTIPATIINPTWTSTVSGNAQLTDGATGTGNILFAVADMAAGSGNEVIFTIMGTIADNFAGNVVNTAFADPAEPNTPPVKSTITTTVSRIANIQIEKTGPAVTEAGTPGQYILRITNDGPGRADNVTIKDDLPVQILGAAWTAAAAGGAVINGPVSGTGNVLTTASLPPDPNAEVVITIDGVLDPSFGGSTFTNTGIALNDPAISPVGDTSSVTTLVNRVANLRVVKAGPANIGAGEPIEYVIRVQNAGPTNVLGAVFQDIVPASILNVTWTTRSLGNVANVTPASGATGNILLTADLPADSVSILEITVRGIVSPAVVNGTSIANTATINLPPGSNATDPNPADNSSTVTTIIDNDPVIRIAKTGPALVDVGDTIRYRVVISNGGAGNITNAQIIDNVPPEITVTGWNATGTGTATVTGAASGNTNNIVTTADIPVGNNTIVITINGIVTEAAGNTIINTASVTAGSHKESSVTTSVNRSTDISIVKSGPQARNAGEPVSYTLIVRNNGKVSSDDLLIADQIPASITNVTWSAQAFGNASVLDSVRIDSSGNLISLPAKIAGGKANNYILIQVHGIISPTAGGTVITNTANVAVNDVDDYNPANNASVVITGIGQLTGVLVRKTGPSTALAGNDIAYDIVVLNQGPSDAMDVAISDLVPPEIEHVEWVVSVTGGASITGPFNGTGNNVATTANIPGGRGNLVVLSINGKINSDFSGTLKNTAVVSGPDVPAIADSAITDVGKQVTLKIRKDGPARVLAGDQMQYILTVNNAGPANARGAVISDTIDNRLNNISWTATAANGATIATGATGSGPTIRVEGDLPAVAGAAITVIVTGTVNEDASGTITNTASVLGSEPGDVPVVSPPVTTVIVRESNLTIDKTGPSNLFAGESVSYTLRAGNAGPASSKGVAITDAVPASIGHVTWQVTGTTGGAVVLTGQTGTGNNVLVTADMPAGSSLLITVTGKTDSSFAGNLRNTAIITPSEAGNDPDTSTVETNVTLQPNVQITKSGPATVVAGAPITWTVTATNAGPSLAKDALISDDIPASILNISWSAAVTGNAWLTGPASGTGTPVNLTAGIPPGSAHSVILTIVGRVAPDHRDSIFNTAIIRPVEPGATPDTATSATEVTAQPKLLVEKNGPATAVAGQAIRYNIRIANQGQSDAINTQITDMVPAPITNVQWAATTLGSATITGPASGTGNNIALQANIPAGAVNVVLLTVDGTVAANATGTIVNTATATPAEPGIPAENATATTQVNTMAKLTISKTGPAEMERGSSISYVVNISNTGPSDAVIVMMTDTISNVLENVSWRVLGRNGATIISGASGTGNIIAVTASLPAADTASFSVIIAGTVRADVPDGNVLNTAFVQQPGQPKMPSNTVVSTLTALTDVAIHKTGIHEVYVGSPVTYTLEITNNGPSAANGTIVHDTVPAGMTAPVPTVMSVSGGAAGVITSVNGNAVLATIGTLPPGGKVILRIVATGTSPGTWSNTGLVYTPSGIPDSDSSNNNSTVITSILAKSRLNIDKSIDPPAGPYYPGQTLTYTLAAGNEGSRGVNPVKITDTLPAATLITDPVYNAPPTGTVTFDPATRVLVWNVGLLDPFEAVSWSYQVTLKDTGTVRNAASIGGPPDVSTPDTSTVIIVTDPQTDLRIVKSGTARAYVGGVVTYRLEISNDGPAPADGASVNDTLPAGLTQIAVRVVSTAGGAGSVQASVAGQIVTAVAGVLPNGGSTILEITAIAPEQPVNVVNMAWVQTPAGLKDSDSANNRSSITTAIVAKNRLELAKSVSPGTGPYYSGQTLTYTLRATNTGMAAVSPVTVVDTIPAANLVTDPVFNAPPQGTASFDPVTRLLTWNAGQLDAGQSVNWTYQVTLKDTGTIRNAASIGGPPDISTPDTSVVIVEAKRYANLKVMKEVQAPQPLSVGNILRFTITATNQGPDRGTQIEVRDTLASMLSAPIDITASNGQISFRENGRVIIWLIPDMPNGAAETATFTAKLIDGAPVINSVSIRGKEIDIDLSDNRFTIAQIPVTGDDIFIPNTITPNGDGRNDNFRIPGISKYPGSHLTVYNRWGNLVYQNKNYDNTWDGNGLREGVYYYILELNTPQGFRVLKGWIELLR